MGYHHTEETKQKLRESKIGAKNPMYGKRGVNYQRKFSDEWRKHLSESKKGKPSANRGKQYTKYGHQVESKVRYAITSAAARGLIWQLEEDAVREIIVSACHYCGTKPNLPKKPGGIDRVDNTKGYVPDNCVPCCWPCNRAKHCMSRDEFLAMIKKIYDNCLANRSEPGPKIAEHISADEPIYPMGDSGPVQSSGNPNN